MVKAWRIVREKHVAAAFSGQGAEEFGSRWNLPGTRVACASGSQSLAALELLVHLNPPVRFLYSAIELEFDESLTESLGLHELPRDWMAEPPSLSTQRIGSRWAKTGRSPVLAVPSTLIPSELNYLLNPLHRDFAEIKIGAPQLFAFGRRLP